ncbi:uncharacterized protein LOC111793348 [Cucurbita pepo subsp. pepo]|uniref:uncharacterized protein LOC111793348 n=1 Tax=Cucurbita pepo subsp. pepo TaxID=3664 RepID=UPI000C9D348D|nr:uncharacterized protein LOC111793348 [Cucurbita pepo subsp. pepo]
MSWLFKSFQASDDDISAESPLNSSLSSSECVHFTTADPSVKDDFTALGETLSRQLRGLSNFLSSQPSTAVIVAADSSESSSDSSSLSQKLQGIRNDLAEINGGLRNGFSMLSVRSNKAVGEICRFATNLLQFQSRSDDDEEDEEFEDECVDDTPGITDEVLNFVNDISLRPEYWTDFPLALVDTDFEMSDVQRIHTSTVEQLIPNISALKIQLQSSMSNERFWMIYFILLLPRFNKDDFELLETSEIVEARNLLLDKFQRKEKSQVNSEDTCDNNNLVCGTQMGNMPSEEKEKSTQTTEGGEGLEIMDGEEENTNHQLKMADSKTSADVKERSGLEGTISFSEIEDYGTDLSGKFSVITPPRTSSSTESSDWVHLHENAGSKLDQQQRTWKQDTESDGGDSSDWFNVDEFD